MFPLYLQYLLIDFRQTFVTGASWDTDDLITFLGQKVKGQGHTIAAEAHSTRRYRRVQPFLVYSAYILTYYQLAVGALVRIDPVHFLDGCCRRQLNWVRLVWFVRFSYFCCGLSLLVP